MGREITPNGYTLAEPTRPALKRGETLKPETEAKIHVLLFTMSGKDWEKSREAQTTLRELVRSTEDAEALLLMVLEDGQSQVRFCAAKMLGSVTEASREVYRTLLLTLFVKIPVSETHQDRHWRIWETPRPRLSVRYSRHWKRNIPGCMTLQCGHWATWAWLPERFWMLSLQN